MIKTAPRLTNAELMVILAGVFVIGLVQLSLAIWAIWHLMPVWSYLGAVIYLGLKMLIVQPN